MFQLSLEDRTEATLSQLAAALSDAAVVEVVRGVPQFAVLEVEAASHFVLAHCAPDGGFPFRIVCDDVIMIDSN